VTARGQEAARPWQDPAYAAAWAKNDEGNDLLALPRAMAAALVAAERPGTRLIVDVGAGPGAFLEAFLTELPAAEGIWCDASEAMLEHARRRLEPFGNRVRYLLGDMTDLDGAGVPGDLDALVTSRAAHHLEGAPLAAFYASAARRLQPGGWLVNLDHVGPADVWDKRYRQVRKRFVSPGPPGRTHHHNYPLPSEQEHLSGFRSAGVNDVDVAWKAFYTCLLMGRTSSEVVQT
jgi:SAM-dependent methyltransferase